MKERLRNWYRGKRRGTRILLALLALVVVLGGGYWGLREVAIRSADHVTVTVTDSPFSTEGVVGAIVYQHTFGREFAADAEHVLNDETKVVLPFDWSAGGGILYGGQNWHYHLAFTWHEILVETMDVTCDHMPEDYTISALGVVAPWEVESSSKGPHFGSVMDMLSDDSGGGAIPPPEAKTWPPKAGGKVSRT